MKHLRGCPLFTHPTQRGPNHPTECTCGLRLKPDGQAARVLRYLRDHPGSSSMDIVRDLRIINTTGRISDLRAAGYTVECRRDGRGVRRYVVKEEKPVTAGVQVEAFG